jgi:hypothetical protein
MGRRDEIENWRKALRTPSAGKSELPFARAYDLIMSDGELSAAEKLVMIQVCRYWPAPCVMTAGSIARGCGLDSRYVRRLIKGLCQGVEKRQAEGKPPRRAYLRRGYTQVHKDAKTTTVRQLIPLCFARGDEGAPGGAASAPPDPGGCAPKPTPNAPPDPPNRSASRNENRKERERDTSPLPAGGQASASRVDPSVGYALNRTLLKEPTEEERRARLAAAKQECAQIAAKLRATGTSVKG